MKSHKIGPALVATAVVAGLALTGCGSGGADGTDGTIELSLLVDKSAQMTTMAQAMADGFNASNQGITIKIETREEGTEGDNIVKTKLATDDMADLFQYNSGALMAALDPAGTMTPITGESFVSNLEETFATAVTQDGEVYGVPIGQAQAGGIFYNKKVYADLGLEIPKTWDEFMANNATIKEAGIDPVIQTYGDTWTSQLFVLADFNNVTKADSGWAADYTANKAKYADEPAIKGFERLQEVYEAGYMNKDFASATNSQGLQMLVDGTGAQYPMLSFVIPAYAELSDDAAENIGLFAQPGDKLSDYGMTAWMPAGIYIPKTTTGDKLEAAKKFMSWVATKEACDVQNEAYSPTGPYLVKGCELPEDVPTAVNDIQQFFTDSKTNLALEFLSPLKGPNLEKITVEVGSGITSAADGAARYDEDVLKQAQQLGLSGW
ncbi:MAG: ABC transporter substrate-binding protein [Propionibacteriaceae bacterium]|nr:ABC transporter substrate-binding protein [Propionibacteriaceae bacterium]